MPLLDVSDVILDIDFLDVMTYTRNVQTVNAGGMAINTQTTNTLYGVVTSDKGDVLTRYAEGEAVNGTILIHTLTKLRNDGAGYDADVITWNGASYTVKTVNDYSRYGRGFICANCEIIPLSGGE
jgi:hypothetical protein